MHHYYVGLAFSEAAEEEEERARRRSQHEMIRLPVPALPRMQELAEQVLLERNEGRQQRKRRRADEEDEDDEDDEDDEEETEWERVAMQTIREAFAPRVQRLAAYLRCVAEELELTQTAMVETGARLMNSSSSSKGRVLIRRFGYYECGHGPADLEDVVALAERAEDEAGAVLLMLKKNEEDDPSPSAAQEEEEDGGGLLLTDEEATATTMFAMD